MQKTQLRDRAWLLGGAAGSVRSITHEQFLRFLDQEAGEVKTAAAAYANVVWVYRCANLRAQAIGGLPWAVLDRAGNEVDWDLPGFTESLARIEYALCIWGASYLLKQRNRVALKGLQWLNPSTVSVRRTTEGIAAFRQQVGAQAVDFSPDDIVYHRLFSAADDLGPGVSPAAVALPASKLAWAANTYAWKFFENGAVPAILLTTDQNIPDAEVERIKTVWDRIFGGVKNAWRTAVLRMGLQPTVIGSPFKDVMMEDVLAQARQQVAVAFGIPQTMLEDAANFATAREHKLSFYHETIFPEADLIADGLNRQLFAPLGLEFTWRFGEVEAVQQDEATKAEAVCALVDRGILSVDEAREQLGLPPRTQTVQASEEATGEKVLPQGLPEEVRRELARWRRKVQRGRVEFESDVLPPHIADAVRQRVEELGERAFYPFLLPPVRARDAAEREVQEALEKVLAAWRGKIVREIQEFGQVRAETWEKFATDLRGELGRHLTAVAADSVLRQMTEVGVAFDWALVNSLAAEWARTYTYDLIKGITETTRKVVSDAIAQFIETEGMTRADLEALLEPAFGEVRASMIAVTEVTRAQSAGINIYRDKLAEEGVEMARVWHTRNDELVCPICGPFNGKSDVAWSGDFPDGPPAHVNCRCWTSLTLKGGRRG